MYHLMVAVTQLRASWILVFVFSVFGFCARVGPLLSMLRRSWDCRLADSPKTSQTRVIHQSIPSPIPGMMFC